MICWICEKPIRTGEPIFKSDDGHFAAHESHEVGMFYNIADLKPVR
jgi:hypothetical protein